MSPPVPSSPDTLSSSASYLCIPGLHVHPYLWTLAHAVPPTRNVSLIQFVWLSAGHHSGFILDTISARIPSLPPKLTQVPSSLILHTLVLPSDMEQSDHPAMTCLLAYLSSSLPLYGWTEIDSLWSWGYCSLRTPHLTSSFPRLCQGPQQCVFMVTWFVKNKIFKQNGSTLSSFSDIPPASLPFM